VPGEAYDGVRAAVLAEPSRLELRIFRRPITGPAEGLLLVEANGICGTDVHFRDADPVFPRILGHEVVGRVVELGERAAAHLLSRYADRLRPLITHSFELADADRAIDVVAGRCASEKAIKVSSVRTASEADHAD
jgi:threonine dehydrogenase-like Zn-dependent dehydrogenase